MEIYSKNISKILKNKKKIEDTLNIQISVKGKKLDISSEQVSGYLACNFFEAVEAGFSVRIALLLADSEYMLEKVSIKNLTKRKNLTQIKARIIGHLGETIKLLGRLSDCQIKLHDNTVYIIGRMEDIKKAVNAVEKLIQGSKQSSVYAYLERQRGIELSEDLGLREGVK